MNDLYLIFDGYHVQSSFYRTVRQPLNIAALQQTRNAFTEAVRTTAGVDFRRLITLFVSGEAGDDIPEGRVRELALANAQAIQPKGPKLPNVRWPIEVRLEKLIVDRRGRIRQPEWSCDGHMIGFIAAAEKKDHIAICTLDGALMRNSLGQRVPGIAAALSGAADRGVATWLFTFKGLGKPGKALLNAVREKNRFECRFAKENSRPVLSATRPRFDKTAFTRELDVGMAPTGETAQA